MAEVNWVAVNRGSWSKHLEETEESLNRVRGSALFNDPEGAVEPLENSEAADLFLEALAHMEIAGALLRRARRSL